MKNDMLFERFLDTLELYLDLRTQYKENAKNLVASGIEWDDVEDQLDDRADTIYRQRDLLQKLFFELTGDLDGHV